MPTLISQSAPLSWRNSFNALVSETNKELKILQADIHSAGSRAAYQERLEQANPACHAQDNLRAMFGRSLEYLQRIDVLINEAPDHNAQTRARQVKQCIEHLSEEINENLQLADDLAPLDFSVLSQDQLEELIDFTLPPRKHFMNFYKK